MTFHNIIFVVLSFEVVWPRQPRRAQKESSEYFQWLHFWNQWFLKSAQARCECMYMNPSLITNFLTDMEGCPFPTLVGIWYKPIVKHRSPTCYDEVNIPECNYNFGACCFRQIIRLLELHAVGNYRLWSFEERDTKLERFWFLPKNQHTQRKFFNFENWTNREPQ